MNRILKSFILLFTISFILSGCIPKTNQTNKANELDPVAMLKEFNQKLEEFESYKYIHIQDDGDESSHRATTIIKNPAIIKIESYKEGVPGYVYTKDSPWMQYVTFNNNTITQYNSVKGEWFKTENKNESISKQLYTQYWSEGKIAIGKNAKGEILGEEMLNGIKTYKAKITYDRKPIIQGLLRNYDEDLESVIEKIEDNDLKEAIKAIEDLEKYVWFDKETKYVVKIWSDNTLVSRAQGLTLYGSSSDASKREELKTMTKTIERYYTDFNNCEVPELPEVE